jgi:hypothetical protein
MADTISSIGATGTYADWNAWEAATRACASTTTRHIGEGQDQVHTVAGGLCRPNSTDVSATYYRIMRQVGGAARTVFTRNAPGPKCNFRLLPLEDNYLRVQDLELYVTTGGDILSNSGNGSNHLYERNLVHGDSSLTNSWGIQPRSTGNGTIIRNNVCYDLYYGMHSGSNTGTGAYLHNNTFVNCFAGVYSNKTGVFTEMRNNLSLNSSNADYLLGAGSWPTRSNNRSSDATGDVGHQNTVTATEITSATPGSEDASLIAGAQSIGDGFDLSGTFTDDFLQGTRAAPFDVGAHQFSSAPTVISCTPDNGVIGQTHPGVVPTWDPTQSDLVGPVTDVEVGLQAMAGDMIENMLILPTAGTFLPCYLRDGSQPQMQIVGTGLTTAWYALENRPASLGVLKMVARDGPWKITLGSTMTARVWYRSVRLRGVRP